MTRGNSVYFTNQGCKSGPMKKSEIIQEVFPENLNL